MADGMEENLGISRRQLIRRGAILGGTVVWVAPAVSTLSKVHASQQGFVLSGDSFACCFCFGSSTTAAECSNEGGVTNERSSDAACAQYCTSRGHPNHSFFAGTQPCQCHPSAGCNCP